MSFSLFCCVYGIGTLGMPGNYARAGYFWATLALVFMAAVNTYATVCLSKVMLEAPKNVRTMGDLGEFVLGCTGRWLMTITQIMTCILVPIAFLVLGGIMCTIMFPDSYHTTTWIIIMGLSLLPVTLIPTLKEGAGAAAAGAFGTIVADAIALYLLVDNMHDLNTAGVATPKPDPGFKQVATTFGNLALAYGAGIVIPALQRDHSDPTRMPRIIYVTLGVISVCFMIVAITGVSAVGCQIPGNLLFAIAGSKNGFLANRGGVILAMLAMQLHVTIAFAVIMTPGFYILERVIFGLHKHNFTLEAEVETGYDKAETPGAAANKDAEPLAIAGEVEAHDRDAATYRQPGVYPKVAALRVVIVAAAVAIACAWEERLLDLLDFTGASCIAVSCMILPMVFYLKHFGNRVSVPERVWAYFAILATLFLAVYATVLAADPLFNPPSGPAPQPKWDNVKFSFCPAGSYQHITFTNVSYHKNFTSPLY
ncbi:hypothetical protein DYB25_009989 [Aphanomyces astaci]|uniref:Amino acid transporter transmembrane domain-containing protein n=3 Tax=Aphanomyces astaci TaxID=112090 RepID=A0A397CHV8_APHAT|nr:hypothetical protein DYB25_009989 [Aphanomyces astaci]RHY38513.1 hypothetical protein DYB30_003997 [Aphanomyces astaci]RHY46721.1 hypothetical protein DYB38_010888 [Aphanomyces astaci]RHY65530.1 hypothetical protein DYB34_010770 [Aphanomyces astaci]